MTQFVLHMLSPAMFVQTRARFEQVMAIICPTTPISATACATLCDCCAVLCDSHAVLCVYRYSMCDSPVIRCVSHTALCQTHTSISQQLGEKSVRSVVGTVVFQRERGNEEVFPTVAPALIGLARRIRVYEGSTRLDQENVR